ncbi:MAG: GDP-mannose 4,6-dehydratase [Acidobacteria bacterium]|nr:GDP-mannose 4,6-dehydratase [Acidobacteriota bacterium]
MTMQRIAVTGSSGFIGSRLIRKLMDRGFNAAEIDLATGTDLLDAKSLSNLGGFDCWIHLAAKSFVPDSFRDPSGFLLHNFQTTLNVLEKARQDKARVIFMSSYLYGEPRLLPVTEEHPLAPHNPYAASKLAGENLCRCYFSDFHVPVTILRPFNIYGSGQNKAFLIPTIINQMVSGYIELMDSRPKRDFVYVDDVVDAIALEAQMNRQGLHIYNLGYGESISVKDLVDLLADIYGKHFEVRFKNEYRKNEILDIVADISKIKNELRWQPTYSIKMGLKKMLPEEKFS